MTDPRSDAELVPAYLAGDRGALATMYDRYSGGLYDTAAAMLGDRHEAADVMQDVILIAAERMAQLRQPERLKPWLYAILRNEVYRRTRRRARQTPTDFTAQGSPEVVATPTVGAEAEFVSVAELAEVVRAAARGLDERDQFVLELSVRQGLQGADLADALGVSTEQSYTMVHRMRERVDKSMTAFVVARAGRRDCADLGDILGGWNGEFTVLLRKRVARHIEHCDTCERTRRKVAPLALMGAAPALAAPPFLRDQILGKAGTPGAAPAHAYQFTADHGFPTIVRAGRSLALLVGAVVAALILGIGGGALLAGAGTEGGGGADSSNSPSDATISVGPTVASTPIVATLPPTTAVETTVAVITVPTSTAPAAPTTTVLAQLPANLVLSNTLIDVDDVDNNSLTIVNTGGSAAQFTLTGTIAPFQISTDSGTVPAGESRTVDVALPAGSLAEGDYSAAIQFKSSVAGSSTVAVTLIGAINNGPDVQVVSIRPNDQVDCQWRNPTITASITDESGVAGATLGWTGPSGQSGVVQMKISPTGSTGIPTIVTTKDPPEVGSWTLTITATDTRNNVTTSAFAIDIFACIN